MGLTIFHFFLPPDMPSNFKLLFFLFPEMQMMFVMPFSFASVFLSSVHPTSGSSSFFGVNHYCFLVAVTFCIYHLLPSLSVRIHLKKQKDLGETFSVFIFFFHHVSFFIWLESFISLSLWNTLCFWEVSWWNYALLYVSIMASGLVFVCLVFFWYIHTVACPVWYCQSSETFTKGDKNKSL